MHHTIKTVMLVREVDHLIRLRMFGESSIKIFTTKNKVNCRYVSPTHATRACMHVSNNLDPSGYSQSRAL